MNPTSVDQLLGCLELFESQRRGLDAARLRLIAAAVDETVGDGSQAATAGGTDREIAYRALRAELALALRLSEHQLESQMRLACELTDHYCPSMDALDEGIIDLSHARVIVEAGAVIGTGETPELARRRAGYEQAVLEVAVQEPPNRLRPIARRLAEQWAEQPLEVRNQKAAGRRRVVVIDCEDGMSDLIAHLPSLEAHAVKDRLTRIARSVKRGERVVRARSEDDKKVQRTRDQLRADVFTDLLLASDEHTLFAGSTAEALQAHVQLVIEASPRVRQGEKGERCRKCRRGAEQSSVFEGLEIEGLDSAELIGCGPIDLGTATGVAAATGRWERVTVDEGDGGVLRVDRYRPSTQLRRFLSARDRHCRFPGCRMPVHRCDLDHTIDAAKGGSTSCDNLAYLCRGHHMMKHHGGWCVAQGSRGVLRWTSPAGRRYVERPPGMVGRRERSECGTGEGRASPVSFSPGEEPEAPY